MFCSNCGKTLKPDDVSCANCGAVVGDSRFGGHPYTGAQVRTKPGEAVRVPISHTRTTYMGSEQPDDGEVDERTTYRATRGGGVPKYASRTSEDALFTGNVDEDELPGQYEYAEDYADDYDEAGDDSYDAEQAPSAEYEYDVDAGDANANGANADDANADDANADDANADDANADDANADGANANNANADDANADDANADDANADDANADDANADDADSDGARSQSSRVARREAHADAQKEPASRRARRTETRVDENEDIDPDELSAREIKIEKKNRVDEDMLRRLKEMDEELDEEEVRPKRAINFNFLKKRKRDFMPDEPDEGVFDMDEDVSDAQDDGARDVDYSDEDISDEELLDDAELLDEDELDFRPRRKKKSAFSGAIKYGIAAAVIVGMLALIIIGLSYLTEKTKTAPIENMTLSLYEEGIKLMEDHVSDEYKNRMLAMYDGTTSSYTSLVNVLTTDLDSIASLLPQSPALNDQRFISTLEAIQSNLNNALSNSIMNALLLDSGEKQTQDTNTQWAMVVEQVASLKRATNTTHLDTIIKGERIAVIDLSTPTPAPTVAQTTTYTVLSKGAKSSAVTQLQTRLKELGYLNDTADGNFGNKTKTAVELFEQTAGLTVDGIADVEMQTRLFAPDAPAKP